MTRTERDRPAALAASEASQAQAKRENAKAMHTPGPWVAGRKHLRGLEHRVYAGQILIADCDGHQGYTRALADARLIAAAPDLLEVLQAIINDGLHCDVVPHLHAKARAAIAKATGETT